MSGCGLHLSGSGYGWMVGSCDHVNESLGSIKGRDFPNQLSDCQLLKEDSGSWN
jgi:hypothetical protein